MEKFEKMINSSFSSFMNYLYKIIVINLLFLLTSALGLIIFTVAPATIAAMVCINGVIDKKDFPIVKTFFHILKKEYKNSMLFFIFYACILSVLGLSFSYYYTSSDTLWNTVGLLIIGFLLIITLLSLIHFMLISIYTPSIKFRSKLKYSYLMIVYSPFISLELLIVNAISIIFAYIFITFSFLFTFAFIGYYNIRITKGTYLKISTSHDSLDVLSH